MYNVGCTRYLTAEKFDFRNFGFVTTIVKKFKTKNNINNTNSVFPPTTTSIEAKNVGICLG